MKKVLYTINFGGYDSFKEPVKTPGWDYVVFSDKDIHTDCTVIRVDGEMPNNLLARYYYMNPCHVLPDYDLSIMIGGQISCDGDLNNFMMEYVDLNYDYNLMNHCRNCIYREADENKKFFGEIGGHKIDRQMNAYRQSGFPPQWGLYAHGIIVCKHSEKAKEHQRLWWKEVSNPDYVARDQLSFMYTAWKHKLITHRGFADYWEFLHKEYFSIYTHGVNEIKKL